jgi:hypothetical protein
MSPGHNFLKGPQKLSGIAPHKYQDLGEEYAVIRETIQEMLQTLASMHEAIQSKLDEAERIRLLAVHHLKMRDLRIKACHYVDEAAEFLAVESALNAARKRN